VDEDLLHYLTQSAQVDSAVGTDVRVHNGVVTVAAGILVQTLPGADGKLVDHALQRLEGGALTSMLQQQPAATPEALARLLFPSETLTRMDGRAVKWFCPCSHERVVDALATLGYAEVKSILEEQGKAEATCDFCRSTYVISADELRELLGTLQNHGTQAS